MGYRLLAGWESALALPGVVVDKHIKTATGTAIKVLLLVLRLSGQTDIGQLSRNLGLPEHEIREALNYWIAAGLLAAVAEFPKMGNDATKKNSSQPGEEQKPRERPGSARRKLTLKQINAIGAKDDRVAFLVREAQLILGRPLTPVDTETITALYSYYGMKPEVVLMLLQHCKAEGKQNMNYVEKVAAGWVESGVDTHEKAEHEILKAAHYRDYQGKIRNILGIFDRTFVSREREFIAKWQEMNIPTELVGIAYERTIEHKGKISFAYMNGIIKSWNAKGITTAAEAMSETHEHKNSQTQQQTGQGGADEMEHIYKYGDV